MQTYRCVCQNIVFFDNCQCVACGRELGYCPGCRTIVALLPQNDGNYQCGNPACGMLLQKCANYSQHNVCNRCLPADKHDAEGLCDCCRFNDTVPDLNIPGNWEKWRRLETAKRRLFYDLSQLGLPYGTKADGIAPSLAFDFKAEVIPKEGVWHAGIKTEQVYTGHDHGRITINIQEADDVQREKLRVQMHEAQRTLIGHFRHEIGHFYWDALVKGRREQDSIAVFGDHNQPSYRQALEAYYKNGPKPGWGLNFVSAYATMHPWEDFAETWATYLDMVSALDTAHYNGFGGQNDPLHADFDAMVRRYQELGVALNEINRSMGLLDVVPEVLAPPVVEKLRYIHRLVQQGRAENGYLRSASQGQPVLAAAQ